MVRAQEAESSVKNEPQPHVDPESPDDEQKKFFPIRTLTCIIIPPAFAAYYVWTYAAYLRPESDLATNGNKPVLNGHHIWWSWFVIGAVGLNFSNYSLAGVEAGMFASNHFQVSEKQLLLHTDKSWSTLGAWKTLFVAMISSRSGKRQMPSWPWIILFGLSVLSWSFVLSGLTLATSAGFIAGHDVGVNVLGVNATTMNQRIPYRFLDQAFQRWRSGAPATLPGAAMLYKQAGSIASINTSTPNIFPADASEGFFLAPQAPAANTPVVGTAWGLQFKYSCTSVHQLNEFSVLNRRVDSKNPAYVRDYAEEDGNTEGDVGYYYVLDDDASINVLSQLWSGIFISANMYAFAEIGVSPSFRRLYENEDLGYSPAVDSELDWITGETSTIPRGPSYPGWTEEDVFEILLWQSTAVDLFKVIIEPVKDPIPGLASEHHDPQGGEMFAIGVRCTSSSVTGNAQIDGLTGIYSNFSRYDPDIVSIVPTPRLGVGMPFLLIPGNTSQLPTRDQLFGVYGSDDKRKFHSDISGNLTYWLTSNNVNWIQSLLRAASTPTSPAGLGLFDVYTDFIQSENLKNAVLEAYKHYKVQIMFGGQEGIQDQWLDANLTAAVPWIFVSSDGGVIPPLVIVVFLTIWAAGCLGLGLVYGTRKRYGANFNGNSLSHYASARGLDRDVIFKP